MIEVRDLTKRFGVTTAVDKLDFTVDKGEILGFLGPNGAGKTTTMRIITGFFPPTQGTVLVNGHDVVDEPLAARRAIGYLPENVPLYGDMRVDEYLRFVGGVKGLGGAEARQEAGRVMELTGIADRAGQLIKQLSKGYRQRVGLAQALVADPPVLILDEPTIGLDPRQIVEIRGLIKAMAGQKTVVLSSHILPEVAATCSRVAIINGGQLVTQGPPSLLQPGGQGAGRFRVIAAGEGLEAALKAAPGVLGLTEEGDSPLMDGARAWVVETDGAPEARAAAAQAVAAAGGALLELSPVMASLEEVFVQLTTTDAAEEAA